VKTFKALLAAGGSAGHVNPALAIADKIKEIFPDGEILFTGTQKGLESKLVSRAGYAFKAIKAAGFQRKLTPKNIGRNAKAAYYYMTAGAACKKIIEEFKPDIVIGTGGYVTAPVLKTASKLGIKTVTHESNSFPGLATKILAKTADKVFVSCKESLKFFPDFNSDNKKYIITGNPLRNDFSRTRTLDRTDALASLGLKGALTVLSFGGSLGANAVTEAVIQLLKWESDKNINHIHAYGGNGREIFEKLLSDNNIRPKPGRHIFTEYIHNMYTCIAAADLVICRSGSMTQTELKAFGRASIQIPWSGATDNHQYHNALSMEKAGAAVLIKDSEISGARLTDIVSKLYNDKIRIRLMEENALRLSTPDAASKIVSEIIGILG
jgi:UDP-N-acetylglucosamine--N-acetylmuramyl-(pentapeptide) pyrophosphoryl-undecaprenol N-acetylglucosamine transferase